MKIAERDASSVVDERREMVKYKGCPAGSASIKANREDWGIGFFAVVSYGSRRPELVSGIDRPECILKAIRFCHDVYSLPDEKIFVDGLCAVHLDSSVSGSL
jgi:hypothetical protein